jgi:hypothetical protein
VVLEPRTSVTSPDEEGETSKLKSHSDWAEEDVQFGARDWMRLLKPLGMG